MALPHYTPERRRKIAPLLEIDEQYLYQITKGKGMASPALARRLHEIDPSATLQELRPDDWYVIWPELIGVEGAPAIPTPQAEGA